MRPPSFSKHLCVLNCLLALGLGILAPGCIQRMIEVRSDPPGAKVYVNGEAAGTTPCDHPFTFYGTVDVTLRAPGYLSHRELRTLSPPWYQFFPLDLVTDFLPLRDVELVEVKLEPAPGEVDARLRKELEEKSEEMRSLLESGKDEARSGG